MKVLSSNDELVEISYIRPSDGKRFRYWCKIEAAEIRWKDEYMVRWAENLRIYYQVSEKAKTLEVRYVIVGEENRPEVKIFTNTDFK